MKKSFSLFLVPSHFQLAVLETMGTCLGESLKSLDKMLSSSRPQMTFEARAENAMGMGKPSILAGANSSSNSYGS